MAAIYRLSLPRRLTNLLVRPLIRLGLSGAMHLLVVPGRTTGRLYSTPVKLVDHDGARWLVAPYGERSWVKNARAAGWVELRHGRRLERVKVVEVEPDQAAPVLERYLRATPVTQRFFDVLADSPLEAFVAEASRHPVFRLEIDHADVSNRVSVESSEHGEGRLPHAVDGDQARLPAAE